MQDEDMHTDSNVEPFVPASTLTVDQAVMVMLGYRGDFVYMVEGEEISYDLLDFLYDEQEAADANYNNAVADLIELKNSADASDEAIEAATAVVEDKKRALSDSNGLNTLASNYRIIIDREITKAKTGKSTWLTIAQDETTQSGHIHFYRESFEVWLEGAELNAMATELPDDLSMAEGPHEKPISKTSAKNLHMTFGLLVELYAETDPEKLIRGGKPNVSQIAKRIVEHGHARNLVDGSTGLREERIKDRIEVALHSLSN